MRTHLPAKGYVGTWGGGGGGTMLKKYISICYMFITEIDYFNQKIKYM